MSDFEIELRQKKSAVLSGETFTEKDLEQEVNNMLIRLNDTGDLSETDKAIINVNTVQTFATKANCRLIYGQSVWWESEKNPQRYNQTFTERFIERNGGKKVTVQRAISVGWMLTTQKLPKGFSNRPVRELIPVAKHLEGGYEISEAEWDKLMIAENDVAIREVLLKSKGKEPKKDTITIKWNGNGDLVMWKGSKKTYLGTLDKEEYFKNEDAKKAIDRIINNAGIVKE